MTANNGWICVEAYRYGPKLRVRVTDKVCVLQNLEQFGPFWRVLPENTTESG